MTQYTVEITDEALADMELLYNHIASSLLSPENAIGQYNRIADAILQLDILPDRFRIMDSIIPLLSEPQERRLSMRGK